MNHLLHEPDYTEYHTRPGVFTWSKEACDERLEVNNRRREGTSAHNLAKVQPALSSTANKMQHIGMPFRRA